MFRVRPGSKLAEPLGFYPTPLRPMDRLGEAIYGRGHGPRLWVKRDDQTGLAAGGNKVRKLEYLMKQAEKDGAGCVITTGNLQSNHARQTAAACAVLGLRCILVLVPGAVDDPFYRSVGNHLLDDLFGAEISVLARGEEPDEAVRNLVAKESVDGHAPFVIPVGGSTALGALGYVDCAREIVSSGIELSDIVVASESGGTQAGLIWGNCLASSGTRVNGISVVSKSGQFEKV